MTSGLLCDNVAQSADSFVVEVGNQSIKANRRRRAVPAGPEGFVADYVPFYFATRSPMMFVIERGGVPTYTEGCDNIVYLVTTIERLLEYPPLPLVFTDRNAVLDYARFTTDADELDELVDWDLMKQRIWRDTADEPDRKERRMAECLVHSMVPWNRFVGIATRNQPCLDRVSSQLDKLGVSVPTRVRPGWYF